LLSLTGGTNNGVITLDGTAPNGTVESNLTFDGTTLTVTGNATISGDLTVSGTTTYINTTTLNIGDNIITLNADFASGAPTQNAGIEVKRGSSATKAFYWDEAADRWYAEDGLYVAGNVVLNGTIDTGIGATEVYLMNQNVRTTDAVTFATVDTGQGATEIHLMNQNVRTTDAVTFATVNTGQGANELYAMDQNVRTTDGVTFATVNTGQGANELYAMDQNVRTTDSPTFATINTGQGANELYAMNQNVRTTDTVTFNNLNITNASSIDSYWTAGSANAWRLIFADTANTGGYGVGASGFGIYRNGLGDYHLRFDTSGNVIAPYSLRSPIFYDSADASYYVDPNGNSVLATALFNLNASSTLRLISAGTNASMIRAGAGDELYIGGNDTWQMRFNGGNVLMDNGGNLGINTSDFSYTASDNASVISTITNNRLFVNGSIQLLGNQDAIVFGRGAASFMRDEEIGFGWGGGWYMTDSTYLRVRNNKTLYSAGDFWSARFYSYDNTAYYTDPSETSNINSLTTAGTTTLTNNLTTGNVRLNLNDSTTYGLADFTENGTHRAYIGLGGSSQSFGTYAAYTAQGFSLNHDGTGKMIISNRGSSRRIDLNTGTEGNSNFTTIRMTDQTVWITPDSVNGNLRSPLYYVSDDTTYLWNSNRIVVNQVTFPYREWDYSWGAHGNGSGTQPMSFRMWDSYTQGGAPSSYGTLIEYYGLGGHQHDQYYFYQGEILHRYGWYGTTNWQSGWRAMLHAGNYGSYAIPISGGINMTGSFGLNDQRLYLRTNGDTNHFIWNADDDWEEMRFYSGTGFRVQSSTGQVPATFTNAGINASNMTIGGAQVWYNSGSWMADLASFGFTRRWGLTFGAGAEFVILDVSGQGYTLVDGSYIAGERGGFWSLENNNTWNSRIGFQNGGGIANFNSPVRINTNNNLYLDYNYGQSIVGVYTSTR
jgi:hypothetical protein